MYTYKLGGILITDELYHDDLDAMTFGRKDQNELMHHGIKGQSWGKRRFQNEDGSLTAAGRNRYDVGDPRQGLTAYSDTGGRGGSSVRTYNGVSNRTRISTNSQNRYGGASGGGGSILPKGSPTTRLTSGATLFYPGGSSSYSFEKNTGPGQSAGRSVTNKVKAKVNDTVNSGKKAADNLFGWVGDKAKAVGDLVSNRDERQRMDEIVNDHYNPETNTFDTRENFDKFDEARTAYLNHPQTLVGEVGNWIGDRAKDIGGAAKNVLEDVGATARGAASDIGNRLTGNIDRNTAESLRRTADFQEDPNAPFHATGEQYTPENLRRQADEYQQRADNSLFSRIGNAAQNVGNFVGDNYNRAREAVSGVANDVGDWASNAASDVRDWGAGAVESGKNFFNNLFGGGNKEPEQPTLSDPNERIITENIIPEQRITEQRIPEQRITEQRIPEQRITENRIEEQRMAEKQAPGGFNSRPLTKEENEIELKRVNDRLNNIDDYYDHLRANNNPQWSNYTKQDIIDLLTKDRDRYQNKINQQQEAERARALSNKPDGVSDEYWREYTFNGGTRDSYDREMNARKNSAVSLSSDKDYAAEQKRLRNIAAQQDRNGFRVEEVNAPVGTVDTSRPYHFTYDPASGQTIVVYDDEKRR